MKNLNLMQLQKKLKKKKDSEKFVDQAFSDFNSTPEQAKVIKEIQLQIFDISGGMPYLLTLICNDFEISGNFNLVIRTC